MNLLTRHSDYALQAFCYMASKNTIVSVSELCDELGLPRAFTRGILQQLGNNGYILSTKGRGGGFQLALPPNKISIAEIVQIFQGPLDLDTCFFRKRSCFRRRDCKLRMKLKTIESQIIKEFESTTIADLL